MVPIEVMLTIYCLAGFLVATLIFTFLFKGAPMRLAAAKLKKKPVVFIANDAGTLDVRVVDRIGEGWVEVGGKAFVVVKAPEYVKADSGEVASKRYVLGGAGVPVLIAHNTRAAAVDPGTLKLMFLDPEKIKEYVSQMNNPSHILWMLRSAELAARRESEKLTFGTIMKYLFIFIMILIIVYFAKSFLGM